MSKSQEMTRVILAEIDDLLGEYAALEGRGRARGWAEVDVELATSFIAGAMATMRRVAGDKSEFCGPTARALDALDPAFMSEAVPYAAGGLRSLRKAVASGYVVSLQESVHAEVFGDFLDMAEHLLEDGYTDAAAVLVGGVLEGHLRNLCAKNDMPTELVDKRSRSRRKKVEMMNTELAKAGIYSTSDQKKVTAWYGVRHDPAHGEYGKHTDSEVKVVLLGVREFVARHPA